MLGTHCMAISLLIYNKASQRKMLAEGVGNGEIHASNSKIGPGHQGTGGPGLVPTLEAKVLVVNAAEARQLGSLHD